MGTSTASKYNPRAAYHAAHRALNNADHYRQFLGAPKNQEEVVLWALYDALKRRNSAHLADYDLQCAQYILDPGRDDQDWAGAFAAARSCLYDESDLPTIYMGAVEDVCITVSVANGLTVLIPGPEDTVVGQFSLEHPDCFEKLATLLAQYGIQLDPEAL